MKASQTKIILFLAQYFLFKLFCIETASPPTIMPHLVSGIGGSHVLLLPGRAKTYRSNSRLHAQMFFFSS